MPLPIRPVAAAAAAKLVADPLAAAPDNEARAPGWWSEALPPTAEQQQRAALVLWRFNCHIAGLAHPSWIEQPAASIGHPAGSAHLLARHGLAGCYEWHCRAAAQRLWLMDGSSIGGLLLALGGLAHAPRLQRIVRGEQRAAVQAAWPEPAWQAAHDALAPKLGLPSSVLPETPEPPKADPQATAEMLARVGAQLLRGVLAPGERAVAGRARLRLPKRWADDLPLELPADAQHALMTWISALWVPQRSPAWAWLF
jgi:hypothetical protein